MGDVIQFKRLKPGEKHKGKSLCLSGFHKWAIVQEKQFDVKQGQLVSLYRCQRCGIKKTTTS